MATTTTTTTNVKIMVTKSQKKLRGHLTQIKTLCTHEHEAVIFSPRCNIYIITSRAYAMMPVSICLSNCPSVTEVHWHIIANLGFKFRSNFTAHCGRRAAGGRCAARRAACGWIISHHARQC